MRFALASCLWCLLAGCSAIPDIVHEPQYHNPFPQVSRVAVIPFFNQSADPTVDSDQVAQAYYNELQAVRGFEVVPVGVTKQWLQSHRVELATPEDFQRLAQLMNVDAVVVGSVTEFTPYYPPRMGLAVRWYAANPNFHPIPPGYGLPWGTKKEQDIPEEFVFDAEFALAQDQLKTQTPAYTPAEPVLRELQLPPRLEPAPPKEPSTPEESESAVRPAVAELPAPQSSESLEEVPAPAPSTLSTAAAGDRAGAGAALPPDWPDPSGLVPAPPSPVRPAPLPQSEPILTHTRLFHGNDADFTERLANYFYFRDDARFGGWQGYLERSEDFIRFCCHLHITEMLAARGGAGETRVVWRWPIRRYER